MYTLMDKLADIEVQIDRQLDGQSKISLCRSARLPVHSLQLTVGLKT